MRNLSKSPIVKNEFEKTKFEYIQLPYINVNNTGKDISILEKKLFKNKENKNEVYTVLLTK